MDIISLTHESRSSKQHQPNTATLRLLMAMLQFFRNFTKGLDRNISCIVFGSTIGTYPYLKGIFSWQQFLLRSNLNSGFERFSLIASHHALRQIHHHHQNNLVNSEFSPSKPKFVESYDSDNLRDFSNPLIRHIGQVLDEIGTRYRPSLREFQHSVLQVNIYSIQHTKSLRKLSADWHQDRRPLNWLRIFILLHDTQTQHGPLSYIDQLTSSAIIRRGFRRGDSIDNSLLYSINLLTGNIGDALLVNTETCIHKAGVPESGVTRSIIEIVFRV